jgi:hypothetical protein
MMMTLGDNNDDDVDNYDDIDGVKYQLKYWPKQADKPTSFLFLLLLFVFVSALFQWMLWLLSRYVVASSSSLLYLTSVSNLLFNFFL